MKDLKKLIEASILGDIDDTIKISDDYVDFQDKLDLVSKINKKYDLNLFAKTDHYKQKINVGDIIICHWLGAVRPGVVIAINDNDNNDNTLTVTFDGILNKDDVKQNKKHNKSMIKTNIAYDIQPFRTVKCSPEIIKSLIADPDKYSKINRHSNMFLEINNIGDVLSFVGLKNKNSLSISITKRNEYVGWDTYENYWHFDITIVDDNDIKFKKPARGLSFPKFLQKYVAPHFKDLESFIKFIKERKIH